MKVLVIAPQPFFQERGTPIAVKLAVETLAKKLPPISEENPHVDLVVYSEGEQIDIPGVSIHRIHTPSWLRGIRPGISWKKILCDVFLFFHVIKMVWQARQNQYAVIHAVEESAFIAWIVKQVFGIPYIYDMDSSLALQLTEKWWWCRPALSLFQYLEGIAIRGSIAVAPVCDALHIIATKHGSEANIVLRDISLLPQSGDTLFSKEHSFGEDIKGEHTVVLYVGNLESYQGIDLLLESFAMICARHADARLVIVGGTTETIHAYKAQFADSPVLLQTRFLGPRPIHTLASLLQSADILVSPRTKGNNTPMKIYSYLHSGTAVLATALPTHTQVLTNSISLLAKPTPSDFGNALESLLVNSDLRHTLGTNARITAEKLYTKEAFEEQLFSLYEIVEQQINLSKSNSLAVNE
jgi:glycosyltransferase involved in cell wall biosynthesis